MKKKSMGDAGKALFETSEPIKANTGAAALTAILSEEAPRSEAARVVVVPKEEPKFAVTTFRLKQEHWEALRLEAIVHAKANGGKADASGVLRSILDGWMTTRAKA